MREANELRKQEKEAHEEIETKHPSNLGAQDTYYMGTIKGVGRIYPARDFRLLDRSADEGEGVIGFGSAATEGGGNVGLLFCSEETDDYIAQRSHYWGSRTGSKLAAVLVHGHVPHPEHPVFDTTMAPPQFQHRAEAVCCGQRLVTAG